MLDYAPDNTPSSEEEIDAWVGGFCINASEEWAMKLRSLNQGHETTIAGHFLRSDGSMQTFLYGVELKPGDDRYHVVNKRLLVPRQIAVGVIGYRPILDTDFASDQLSNILEVTKHAKRDLHAIAGACAHFIASAATHDESHETISVDATVVAIDMETGFIFPTREEYAFPAIQGAANLTVPIGMSAENPCTFKFEASSD